MMGRKRAWGSTVVGKHFVAVCGESSSNYFYKNSLSITYSSKASYRSADYTSCALLKISTFTPVLEIRKVFNLSEMASRWNMTKDLHHRKLTDAVSKFCVNKTLMNLS